jgi:hypothetical protein
MPRRITPQAVAQWRDRFQRYHRSELSLEAFCREEGVSSSAFYNWRKRLSAADTAAGASQPSGRTFAPVCVVGSTCGMSIVLPSGARIEIGAGHVDLARAVVGELTRSGGPTC